MLQLRLAGSVIEELRDADTGRELGAAFLEPELVGAYYGPDHEQRELVRVGDVPPHLIDAILAVEDQRFLEPPRRRLCAASWARCSRTCAPAASARAAARSPSSS